MRYSNPTTPSFTRLPGATMTSWGGETPRQVPPVSMATTSTESSPFVSIQLDLRILPFVERCHDKPCNILITKIKMEIIHYYYIGYWYEKSN